MMSSINAIGTILIVLGSIALSVGAFVLFLFIKRRIYYYAFDSEDIAEIVATLIFAGIGICLISISPNQQKRIKMFYELKPACQEETIDCLQDKAKWYKDSVEYHIPPRERTNLEIIDSLKTFVNQYEKGNN